MTGTPQIRSLCSLAGLQPGAYMDAAARGFAAASASEVEDVEQQASEE